MNLRVIQTQPLAPLAQDTFPYQNWLLHAIRRSWGRLGRGAGFGLPVEGLLGLPRETHLLPTRHNIGA